MISIKGIRIDDLSIGKEGDNHKIEGSYSLISSADKVLAKQAIGGYHGMKIEPSASTVAALDAFLAAYKADVNKIIGLEIT